MMKMMMKNDDEDEKTIVASLIDMMRSCMYNTGCRVKVVHDGHGRNDHDYDIKC
jgi:hypothetical protein